MKLLRTGFLFLSLSLSSMACGVAPEETGDASTSQSTEQQAQAACEPGPSSNFCSNVDGKACTATATRRCYIPNYCEWMVCRCTNGTWVCM